MYIFSPDALRTQVEAATGGFCTVLYDDLRNPHYMRIIPKFTYEDLGLDGSLGAGTATAFLVDGDEVDQLFIGQYLANQFVSGGDFVTLPRMTPAATLDYDATRAKVAAMGRGWHIMTAHEWAAIVWWMVANQSLPLDYAGGTTLAGWLPAQLGQSPAPPATRHDQTPAGIDGLFQPTLVDLVKVDEGRVFCTPDNVWDESDANWTGQAVWYDSPSSAGSIGDGDQGAPKLTDVMTISSWGVSEDNGPWNYSGAWSTLISTPGYASNQLMKRLLMEHVTGPEFGGFVRNYGERMVVRGTGTDLAHLNIMSHRTVPFDVRLAYAG